MIDHNKLHPKVIEYIEVMIIDWPTLFLYDRYEMSCLAVLKQLFGTIGNGVVWKNGEPVIERRYFMSIPDRMLDAREIGMLTGRGPRQQGVPGSYVNGGDFLHEPILTANGPYEMCHYRKIRVEWLEALRWTLSAYLELADSGELYLPTAYEIKGPWSRHYLEEHLKDLKRSESTIACLKAKLKQANEMKPYIRRTRKAKENDLKNSQT